MRILTTIATLATLTLAFALPSEAEAQRSRNDRVIERRQDTKAEWQKSAYAGAAIALLGHLTKDNNLKNIGALGSLYSVYRMEEDSKSQDRAARDRAAMYNRPFFYKNGVKYVRTTVKEKGKTYYCFVKGR